MVSYHPLELGENRHCYWEYIFSGWRGRFQIPSFQSAIIVHLKDIVWKLTAYHINNSDPDHTHLKQQYQKNMKITSACPSKNNNEKEKDK